MSNVANRYPITVFTFATPSACLVLGAFLICSISHNIQQKYHPVFDQRRRTNLAHYVSEILQQHQRIHQLRQTSDSARFIREESILLLRTIQILKDMYSVEEIQSVLDTQPGHIPLGELLAFAQDQSVQALLQESKPI